MIREEEVYEVFWYSIEYLEGQMQQHEILIFKWNLVNLGDAWCENTLNYLLMAKKQSRSNTRTKPNLPKCKILIRCTSVMIITAILLVNKKVKHRQCNWVGQSSGCSARVLAKASSPVELFTWDEILLAASEFFYFCSVSDYFLIE